MTAAGGMEPHRVGEYRLVEEVGRGGMGVVYRAWQPSLNRFVAIKVLLHGRFSQIVLSKQFQIEAETAARLEHPNIVPIYEIGQQDGLPYYAMRLVEGRNLADELSTGPMPPRKAAGLIATLARTVHYAHQRGVLHRDLKPHNILLDHAGQPYLTDFGLARLLEEETSLSSSTAVVGSPPFMAPEQASGRLRHLTTATDIYGLGAVLYALLTGRPPFVGQTPLEVIRKVNEEAPVAPSRIRRLTVREKAAGSQSTSDNRSSDIDRNLETICLKCLEKEPARRYGSAEALADDLERWLRAQPIQARPVSAWERTGLWCRRQPLLAALLVALGLVLGLGAAGVLWSWHQAKEGELQARRDAYATDMAGAQNALAVGDLREALACLNRQRPAPGQSDLRHWEWRYLCQRCRSEELFAFGTNSDPVAALASSADGQWLALRRKGGAISVWDVSTRRAACEFPARGAGSALAFSPQGGLLAYGASGADGQPGGATLYDFAKRETVARMAHGQNIVSLSFSGDGTLLGTLAAGGASAVWDLGSQRELARIETDQPYDAHWEGRGLIALAPDGRRLAIGDRRSVLVWDWQSGRQTLLRPSVAGDGVSALAWSRDSKLLAAACDHGDHSVYLWELADAPAGQSEQPLAPAAQLRGHTKSVGGLAFAPDGRRLASAGADQSVRLWDVPDRSLLRQFRGHTSEVSAVTFVADGTCVVSGGRDGRVRAWNARAAPPEPVYTVLPFPARPKGIAFLADSRTFIAIDYTNRTAPPSLWETAPLRRIESLAFLGTNNSTLTFSPDLRLLAVGDWTGDVRVWDFAARRLVRRLAIPGRGISCVWFRQDGRVYQADGVNLRPGDARAMKLWNVADWSEIPLPPDIFQAPEFGTVSADGRVLAQSSFDGTLAWWDLASGRRMGTCQREGPPKGVIFDFSPDGRLLATPAAEDFVSLWDVRSGRALPPLHHNNLGTVQSLSFSRDGRRLVTVAAEPGDATVNLIDLSSRRVVLALTGPPEPLAYAWFSPDGNTLIAAGYEGPTLLWRAPSPAESEAADKP